MAKVDVGDLFLSSRVVIECDEEELLGNYKYKKRISTKELIEIQCKLINELGGNIINEADLN